MCCNALLPLHALMCNISHPPAALIAGLALVLLPDAVALSRWALVYRALGNGAAVACITVRLGLVPWQVVLVILRKLVASRPVLVALQARGDAKPCTLYVLIVDSRPALQLTQSKGMTVHLEWAETFCMAACLP
jgi:hypothetical protein